MRPRSSGPHHNIVMTPADLSTILCRDLEGVEREIALFPDDASIWQTTGGMPNAAGNLALHLAGNIQHFIGAIVGGTDYRRNRPLEFSQRSGSRADVAAEVARAASVVRAIVPNLAAERLAQPLVHPDLPGPILLGRFLMHLAVHVGYHLGQIDYARRGITGDGRPAGLMALAVLIERPAVGSGP